MNKAWMLAAFFSVLSLGQGVSGKGLTIHSQTRIREYATVATLPPYPSRLVSAKKEGLVVLEVSIGPGGVIRSTKVVESFNEEASSSVVSTVKRWRFKPFEMSLKPDVAAGRIKQKDLGDVIQTGKLLFLFKIDGARSRVVDLGAEMLASQQTTKHE